VVQAGSFSAAARELGMPVTTVSGIIARLEKRLGVTLIQRTTRKLNITSAGGTYYKHCVLAMNEMSEGENELFTAKSEPAGLLRITAPPDLGHSLLPPIVRKYLKAYPRTKIELLLTNRIVDLIGEGVDLAIRPGPFKDSSLVVRKFKNAEVFLWVSPSYIKKRGLPRHPRELASHFLIGHQFFGATLKLTNGRESFITKVEPRIIVDDVEAVKTFVMAGDGISALPDIICESEAASGKIIRVLPGWSMQFSIGQVSIYFVFSPQRYVPPKIQSFIDLATQKSIK
jgi:DNA-binding transcriptional LysR family regulator